MLKNNISNQKLLNTFTPTGKMINIYNSNSKYDLLYISSNWHQNKLNLSFTEKF